MISLSEYSEFKVRLHNMCLLRHIPMPLFLLPLMANHFQLEAHLIGRRQTQLSKVLLKKFKQMNKYTDD